MQNSHPLDKKTKTFLIILASSMAAFILICAIIIAVVKLGNTDGTPTPTDADAAFQQESTRLAAEYAEKHPVIIYLPIEYANYDQNYVYTEFRIDGGSFDGCSTDFCLMITDESDKPANLTAHEAAIRQQAASLLQEQGQNPDDYEILYQYNPVKPL